MSFSKKIFEETILVGILNNQQNTFRSKDMSHLFERMNMLISIVEMLEVNYPEFNELWSQVVVDLVGAFTAAVSGFYRQAESTMRNVLELSCYIIYFMDHKIELYTYRNFDSKAESYISKLISKDAFYTTKYISAFYPEITNVEKKVDSISGELFNVYGKLCDVTHGRYKTLSSSGGYIEFNYENFGSFEKMFMKVTSLIVIIASLRERSVYEKYKTDVLEFGRKEGVFK